MNGTRLLDALLERLAAGDVAAAEEVYVALVPALRVMVRRRLNPKLRARVDSLDVVQAAWADVLQNYREDGWAFHDVAHLKAFLNRVTYNHIVNACRKHARAGARERPLPAPEHPGMPASPEPRPSEHVRAEELWERMLDLCPPHHRELLRLKREGFGIAEIAARTGLHEGSVRRILYDLARRLSLPPARQTSPA